MKSTLPFLLITLTFTQLSFADRGSLSKCQRLADAIEKYSDLRRAGGSAKQMDTWKRRRSDKEDQFKRYDCKDWGKRIK